MDFDEKIMLEVAILRRFVLNWGGGRLNFKISVGCGVGIGGEMR